jgi:hypothetical protein
MANWPFSDPVPLSDEVQLRLRIEKLEHEAEEFRRAIYAAAFRDMAQAVGSIRASADADPSDPVNAGPGRKQFPRGTVMDHYRRTTDTLHDEHERDAFEETFHQFTRARELGNLTIGQRYRAIRGGDALIEFTQNGDQQQLSNAVGDFSQIISAYIPAAHVSQLITNQFTKFVDARVKEILDAKFAALQAETDQKLANIDLEFNRLKTHQTIDNVFKGEVAGKENDPEDLRRQGWISQEAPFIVGA